MKLTAQKLGRSQGHPDLYTPTRRSPRRTSFATVALGVLAASVSFLLVGGMQAQASAAGTPILVVASDTNPFSRYYGEILQAEGLNEFTIMDVSLVNATVLALYDVVILGELPLTVAQVSMFSNYVMAGGNLIAMRPDKQLTGLLGLTAGTATLSEAYLLVDSS